MLGLTISGLDQLDENELQEVQDFVGFIICRHEKRNRKNRKGIDDICYSALESYSAALAVLD